MNMRTDMKLSNMLHHVRKVLKKSLRLVEKDSEHLTIRCPLSGDYLEIVGEKDDLEWLDNELRKQGWYRPNC